MTALIVVRSLGSAWPHSLLLPSQHAGEQGPPTLAAAEPGWRGRGGAMGVVPGVLAAPAAGVGALGVVAPEPGGLAADAGPDGVRAAGEGAPDPGEAAGFAPAAPGLPAAPGVTGLVPGVVGLPAAAGAAAGGAAGLMVGAGRLEGTSAVLQGQRVGTP
jgi:hypothetical protein